MLKTVCVEPLKNKLI